MKCRQIMAIGICALMISSSGSVSVVALGEDGTQTAAETPASQAPAAETAPATEAPPAAEAPPATEAPAAEVPPATEAPVTEAPPATEAPVTEAPPATEAPVTEAPVTEAPSSETQPATETAPATETPDMETEPVTESPVTETAPGETGTETELPGTELITEEEETEEESETEGTENSEAETQEETDGLIEDESDDSSGILTNEQLIARQNIVTPSPISLEFRFVQTEKVYAVVKNPEGALVKEERSQESSTVGKMEYYGLCYILADAEEEWVYVESGNVRGFIRAEDIVTGDTAGRLVRVKGEENLPTASLTLARSENSAYTYTHTTVYPVLASKVYALAKENLDIREARQDTARSVGTLEQGGLCYILADQGSEWVYVESGNARGFVRASSLDLRAAQRAVALEGENNLTLATVTVEPRENGACYYTLTSVREASQSALLRSEVVNYAFRFLGNPYVWGGTSLTSGCDCSGFTQSIYAHFGYYLPRVAEAQAVCNTQIPISYAEPGDLIFYARNGYVYHVSMYIGDGQVIHAANTRSGIIISGIGSDAVWATRVIQD